jgi:hydrogenase maturation protein HypF
VGFRPFVYSLARRWNLAGFVRNDSAGITLEIEGQAREFACFQQTLCDEAPPLARIDTVVAQALLALGDIHAAILESLGQSEPPRAGLARRGHM